MSKTVSQSADAYIEHPYLYIPLTLCVCALVDKCSFATTVLNSSQEPLFKDTVEKFIKSQQEHSKLVKNLQSLGS